MKPFYFRDSGKSLFGIYHPPSSHRARKCGIVICHPIGHEYIHGYRALRQLANQLARAGFAVLRFDYYGCGDSAGDAIQATLLQWLNDVHAAIDEIRSRAHVSKIGLIGARLGATLSLLVGSERSDVDATVLWDPVVNGKRYIAGLIAQHHEWLDERPTRLRAGEADKQVLEVLGFPINAALREGIERLDLLMLNRVPVKRVLTLEGDKTDRGVQLSEHLKAAGAESDYQHVAASRVWLRKQGGDNVVVPVQILQAIVNWTSRIT